jgi:hypothetical protein
MCIENSVVFSRTRTKFLEEHVPILHYKYKTILDGISRIPKMVFSH